ncbi:MAG: serine protease, partial [Actinomycetota bacterium]|nr:serine protease [Actinomycetota bacterium]
MASSRTTSIVTIRRDGVPVGVGFLVGRDRVVTCAHVVNAALGLDVRGQDRPDESFLVEFALIQSGVVRTAKVVLWVPPPRAGAAPDGEADIAGLELTEPAPRSAKPLRFATPRPHSAVDVYGYPAQPARP